MPTFAFWNLNQKVTQEAIRDFARESDADVVVLAENPHPVGDLLKVMNRGTDRLYSQDAGHSDRLTLLTRFDPSRFHLVTDRPGIAIRHYQLPLGASFLVVAVHLASKMWKQTEDHVQLGAWLGRSINEAEVRFGHSRTIVIGDLNMNPFEAGVVGSEGLHAVMDRRIAVGGSRKIQGESRAFFYNPMWSLLGDGDDKPPGTYFYNSGNPVNYYWNTFDQILLRPSLLKFLGPDGISVVTQLGGQSLLTAAGRPNQQTHSDHLPVVCRLNTIEETEDGDEESVG
ncbi:MAG: endonuclease/exonuclease/phosphatase family protein [Planctomycetaceae bacterium]|nr:endonuclease/exonuclease/phosphatase family protein [Planctomycetaceae bacterium]